MPQYRTSASIAQAQKRHGYALVWVALSFLSLILTLFFLIGPAGGVHDAPRWQQYVLMATCLSFGWSFVDVITTARALYRTQRTDNP